MKARSRPASKKPSRSELKPGQRLCDFCTGKCCRYFSLPIDTPHTWDDFDPAAGARPGWPAECQSSPAPGRMGSSVVDE